MSIGNKQKEVLKFIQEEKLQVYAIIETHIKAKKIKDVCDKMFGSWEWTSNSQYSMNSWKVKFFCTFVYASNNKEERKILWKELYMHKRVIGDYPWALLGDLNVTLNIKEHSSGGSFITDEMQEFKDCINLIEVEDIRSSRFFYTWTKSLKNPDNSVLKKLDRIMVSEAFLENFAVSTASTSVSTGSIVSTVSISLDLSRLATTLNRLERSIQIGINKWYQSLLRNSE
ncbi:RNA-directed DNA polymerase, eukaryota, reverse transcriptase zinc-binding domain protein [Tanacetum coccineum]